jgi:hypothetical protein
MAELLRPTCSRCGQLAPVAIGNVHNAEVLLRGYLVNDFGWSPSNNAGGDPWLCHWCDAHDRKGGR